MTADHQPIRRKLLRWYDRHARELPWRVGPTDRKAGLVPDPYRVWLSEVMLQQTTVATVTPRYQIFLDRWPNVQAMAAASEADILEEWAGLGYYARARNLHKCSKAIVESHDGIFPRSPDALRGLPGIGDYTAAAIAAIAFDAHAIVVDGNIERVTARLAAIVTPLPAAKAQMKEVAALVWPKTRSGDFAQALMDLGATVCTPKNPECDACPIADYCEGKKQGIASGLPKKIKKATKPTRRGVAFASFNKQGEIWLERRPDKGLLGGTLGLPGSEWQEGSAHIKAMNAKSNGDHAGTIVHTFTHFHLVLDVVEVHDTKKLMTSDGEWADPVSVRVPTVMRKAIDAATTKRRGLV